MRHPADRTEGALEDVRSGLGRLAPPRSPDLMPGASPAPLAQPGPGALDVVVLAARAGRSNGMVVILLRSAGEGGTAPTVRAFEVSLASVVEVDPDGLSAIDLATLEPPCSGPPAIAGAASPAIPTGVTTCCVPWSGAMLQVRLREGTVDAELRVAARSPSSGLSGPEARSASAGR